MNTPTSHEPYTDTYFLRSKRILEAEELNPYVRAQVFIRKGPGTLRGIEQALDIIETYSDLRKNGGRILSLPEGSQYNPNETLLIIEGRIQDIITLETMYLGAISAATTKANDGTDINLSEVRERTAAIVEATKGVHAPQGRPVAYFGARHWSWDRDAEIARAAYEGGATSCSTDIGAATFGQKGIGTIPHALENIYAWAYGYEHAVVESTRAFDRVIDPSVPRIALIDYANKEVDDAVATAEALEGRLAGVRIDTCGENIGQGALAAYNPAKVRELFGRDLNIPEEDMKYWFGNGVTVTGTYAVRKALDQAGHGDVKIFLSSGFGDVEKVRAFTRAEEIIGLRLYDALGVGGLYHSRSATMDIVAVGESLESLVPVAKIGRMYRPNHRLEARVLQAA